jgi:hypothetical protein
MADSYPTAIPTPAPPPAKEKPQPPQPPDVQDFSSRVARIDSNGGRHGCTSNGGRPKAP